MFWEKYYLNLPDFSLPIKPWEIAQEQSWPCTFDTSRKTWRSMRNPWSVDLPIAGCTAHHVIHYGFANVLPQLTLMATWVWAVNRGRKKVVLIRTWVGLLYEYRFFKGLLLYNSLINLCVWKNSKYKNPLGGHGSKQWIWLSNYVAREVTWVKTISGFMVIVNFWARWSMTWKEKDESWVIRRSGEEDADWYMKNCTKYDLCVTH